MTSTAPDSLVCEPGFLLLQDPLVFPLPKPILTWTNYTIKRSSLCYKKAGIVNFLGIVRMSFSALSTLLTLLSMILLPNVLVTDGFISLFKIFIFWLFQMACGILVPTPGIQPTSPALPSGVLPTGPPGKSLSWLL